MTIDPRPWCRDGSEAETGGSPSADPPRRDEGGTSDDAGPEGPSEIAALRAAARLAEERLAFVFTAADAVGWWDWDVEADLFRTSPGFARLFGLAPEAAERGLSRAVYLAAVHPDDLGLVEAESARALAIGGAFTHELRVQTPSGAIVWLYAHGRCDLDAAGRAVRCSGVALDISARKASDARKSALVELGDALRDVEDAGTIALRASEVMARALGATRAGFGVVDPVDETVIIQPDWRAPGVASLAGLHRFRDYGSFVDDLKRGEPVIIPDVATDPRTAATAEALIAIGIRVLVNIPLIEHGRFVFVVFVHHDRPHVWSGPELAFVRNVADRTQAAIARLRAEEQRRLLHRELGHRLKNNQAMVQAIVSQTLRNAPDLPTARTTLAERLQALGRAHEVLFSGEAEAAEVGAVIEGALGLHDDGKGRIGRSGPPLRISAAAALSLALILHELATNAAKYGALSVPDGCVRVSWSTQGAPGGERLFLFTWRESGGPAVEEPTRKGFGTRLIERGLATAGANGTVRLDYAPEGFACELAAPLAEIGPAA